MKNKKHVIFHSMSLCSHLFHIIGTCLTMFICSYVYSYLFHICFIFSGETPIMANGSPLFTLRFRAILHTRRLVGRSSELLHATCCDWDHAFDYIWWHGQCAFRRLAAAFMGLSGHLNGDIPQTRPTLAHWKLLLGLFGKFDYLGVLANTEC